MANPPYKVIAAAYLADGLHSYKPGDEIVEGTLFEQAEYYATVGSVRLEPIVTPPPDEPESKPDIEDLTVAELQDMARERGISYAGLRKAELIEALSD